MRSRGIGALVVAAALVAAAVFPAAAKTTVQFWSWAQNEELDTLKKHIQQFEAANPDIDVQIVNVAWTDIATKLPVAVAGGVAPDLVTVSSYWGYDLADGKVFMDLRPFIQAEMKQNPAWDVGDIFPGAMQMWQTVDGEQFAFPDSLDIQGVFYNTDVYDQYGLRYPNDKTWNWDNMLTESIKMTKDINGDGKMERWGISDYYFNWYQLILANGGQILTRDFKNAMNTPAARQAWEYWKKFYDNKAVRGWVTAQEQGDASFRQGYVGLQPAGYWLSLQLNNMDRKINYDVTGMPLSPAGKRAAVADGSGVMIPADAKHPDAAWRLIAFLHSKEVQKDMVKQPGAMPLRRSAASIAFGIPDPPKNKMVFGEILEYTMGNPKVRNWSKVRTALFRAGSSFFNGSKSLDQALEQFSTDLAAALK